MYQTLYRKYRPKNFSDIVGQDVITTVLRNSIKNNKIAHAYLFIGPRGTGKTSTAKIFARAVNCTNTNDGDLCDQCEMCEFSRNKDSLDIIEIDAASNNGVDEIRNIREIVNLVPSELKYKVYIIDEVHMLTIQAFNALLKTLEEPPEHIIFILATTDPQKVPATILSRCQCFNFNRISEDNIIKNLSMISEKENINIDSDVLKQIAIVSDGGMRDAIGSLDKLASYSLDNINMEDFLNVNGLVTNTDIEKLIDFVVNKDLIGTTNLLEDWNNAGNNLVQIMIQVLNFLKDKIVNDYLNDVSFGKIKIYQDLANLLNEKLYDIRLSSNPKIYIEILLLNFISNINTDLGNNISREIISNKNEEEVVVKKYEKNETKEEQQVLNSVEKNVEVQKVDSTTDDINENENVIVNTIQNSISNIDEIMKIRVNNAFVGATKEIKNKTITEFQKLNEFTFDSKIGYLVCNLLDGNIELASDQYLVLSYEHPSIVLDNVNNISLMEDVLSEKLNISTKLAIITTDEWKNSVQEFMQKRKDNISYELMNEPELKFVKSEKNEKKANNDSILDQFSDILEVK